MDDRTRGYDLSVVVRRARKEGWVLFFFSNRLGCLGSVLVSLVATGLLLLVLAR